MRNVSAALGVVIKVARLEAALVYATCDGFRVTERYANNAWASRSSPKWIISRRMRAVVLSDVCGSNWVDVAARDIAIGATVPVMSRLPDAKRITSHH